MIDIKTINKNFKIVEGKAKEFTNGPHKDIKIEIGKNFAKNNNKGRILFHHTNHSRDFYKLCHKKGITVINFTNTGNKDLVLDCVNTDNGLSLLDICNSYSAISNAFTACARCYSDCNVDIFHKRYLSDLNALYGFVNFNHKDIDVDGETYLIQKDTVGDNFNRLIDNINFTGYQFIHEFMY